ncbi:MAG: GNAT family N-acetyltransferase [Desulfobacteraceae bacterium]|jgi:N-acetylglutamate synthase-like GNAT family acetyltransferase
MPRLYIEEYTRALSGKTVCVACREGILRDHFSAVVADIKFLNRYGVRTVLYHNVSNRFANQKYFRELDKRLPETRIVRLLPEVDFYNYVLDHEERVHKLIFLERKALLDRDGRVINALTTPGVRQSFSDWGEPIANVNFMSVLERICIKIDQGQYDRVHILAAGKNAIKHELFTIEGHGSLIANNFVEQFKPMAAEEELQLIKGILKIYQHQGYLKPRTEAYLREHWKNFYVSLIDEIVVGCVEKKIIDARTVEIAALAISTKFRNQRVGVFTVKAFMENVRQQGYTRFISLTNNPNLKRLYERMGFVPCTFERYAHRQAESPDVEMFYKEIL